MGSATASADIVRLEERVARLEERDKGLTQEIHLLREDVRWLREKVWLIVFGSGAASGSGAAAVVALANYLSG